MTATAAAEPTEMAEVQDIKLKLENYYGPLDLLLQLVKEDEVDVLKVRMAQVVGQYIEILQAAKSLNMDLAGEFLVLSSQLMLIKSRRVVPPLEPTEEGAPEAQEEISVELIRKLLEYKRFKELAQMLEGRYLEFAQRHGRPRVEREQPKEEEAPIEVDLWKLVSAYARLASAIQLNTGLNIVYQDVPLETIIQSIIEKVAGGSASFEDLVGDWKDRPKVVGHLLALLELVRQQVVDLSYDEKTGEIRVASKKPESQ